MGALFVYNFAGPNAPEFGPGWAHDLSQHLAGGFVRTSNLAVPVNPGVDDSGELCILPVALNPDHYAEATYASTSAGGVGGGSGVMCRAQTKAVLSTLTAYRLVGNASGYELLRFINGANTSLSSGAGTTFTAADKIRLEVRQNGAGVDWICFKNGTSFASGNDATSLPATGRYGLAFSTSGSTSDAFSAFEGGDFVTPNVPTRRRLRQDLAMLADVSEGGHFNDCNIKAWF